MDENYQERNEQREAAPSKMPLILSIISLVGVIALFILYFTGNKTCDGQKPASNVISDNVQQHISAENAAFDGNLSIAYVDTDRIMKEYKMVDDIYADIDAMRTRKAKQWENKVAKLQSDVQDYIQIGASLTLTQQQEREAEFQRRETQLGQEEQHVMTEIAEYSAEKNTELTNKIADFINRYNNNHNYTLILEKSGINGVIYGDKTLDITSEVVDGLNAEYVAPQ